MKATITYLAILLIISGCLSQKDYIAEYDFNYSGNFKRYKTFSFVANPFPDTTFFHNTIENTISNRLDAQGFRVQNETPDLLINYKIFRDSIKYRGYEQPNFDYWLSRRTSQIEVAEENERENRERDENYNSVRYKQNTGMLVIYVIDNKRGSTIWQGYTAADFDFMSPEINTELTKATYRVMDQFKVLTKN